MIKTISIIAVLIGALLILPASAMATSFYGIDDDTDKIYLLDNTDGSIRTPLGGDPIPDEIESLTWAGANIYYGAIGDKDPTSALWKFEITGMNVSRTLIGNIDGPEDEVNIESLQWINGSLYAMDNESDSFLRINPTNAGVITSTEMNSIGHVEGLAYHNGSLYASETSGSSESELWEIVINPDGTIDENPLGLVGSNPLIMPFGQVEALLSLDGILYGASDSDNTFFSVNLLAGTTTTKFTNWVSDIEGMAPAANSVPEPATMVLLGIGMIGLAGLKRRVKKPPKLISGCTRL
jgi:hypothetical protein